MTKESEYVTIGEAQALIGTTSNHIYTLMKKVHRRKFGLNTKYRRSEVLTVAEAYQARKARNPRGATDAPRTPRVEAAIVAAADANEEARSLGAKVLALYPRAEWVTFSRDGSIEVARVTVETFRP